MSDKQETDDDTRVQGRNGSITLKYPMLTRSNYAVWAIKMEVFMEAQGVWEAVTAEGTIENTKDKMALAAIYQGIGEDTLLQIGAKKTAKEAWTMLKTMNLGADKVKEVRTQTLWRDFEALKMGDADSIDEYSGKLTIIVNKLRGLGNTVMEEQVVKKLLRSTSSKFLQITSTIEEFGDLKTKTTEEVIGSLKAHEERLIGFGGKQEETALLTRAEWLARDEAKSPSKPVKDQGSTRGGRGRDRGRGRGRGRGGRGDSRRGDEGGSQPPKKKFDKSKIQCYNCDKMGHFASECYSKEKEEKAHLQETREDGESALLMLEACELVSSQVLMPNTVMLHEEKRCLQTMAEEKSTWYLDTGASNHMSGEKAYFTDLDLTVHGKVRFGDGSVIDICGRGSVLFKCKNEEHLILSGVYYIPRLKSNIVSLGQLEESENKIVIEGGFLRIYDKFTKLIVKVERQANRLYVGRFLLAKQVCLMAKIRDAAWLWHARYGHLNFNSLRRLASQKMVKGMPSFEQANQFCDGCVIGKQHRMSFPQRASFRAQGPLELVHGDLCGPISPTTGGGNRYFLLLVDDFSRFMWVSMLKSKDEAFSAFKKFKRSVEVEKEKKLKAFRTDRGGEFTSTAFKDMCEAEGVKRFLTAPYSPQQNGVVERRNQTILEMVRSMMKSKKMPGKYWGEAVQTAVYILNRAPTKSVEGMTPYEAWHGRVPKVHHLRVFGCLAHIKDVTPHLPKLADRSKQAVLLGYEEGSKAYRLYDPSKKKIIVSRDVIFEEEKGWCWEKTDEGLMKDQEETFTVHYGEESPQAENSNQNESFDDLQGGNSSPHSPTTPSTLSSSSPDTGGSGSSSGSSSSPDSENAERKFRSLQEIYDSTREVEEEAGLCFLSSEEPATYEEASKSEEWRLAMEQEISSIRNNGTWEAANLPSDHKAIGLKWVFKLKKNPDGKILKHKARLVAKGYVQRYGVDYNEVYAPVARLETIRMLLAYAAQRNWEIHHMDVKTAFLNGELEEEVYVAQPEGYRDKKHPHKVLKLHKALYGLKQAPRAWNSKLDQCLKTLGFEKCPHEHAVYRREQEGHVMIVGVYVDDLILTGANTSTIKQFKEEMKQKFEMSDLGLLSYYLGIEVKQGEKSISICQSGYARNILEKMGMGDCNPCQIPMEPRTKMSKDGGGEPPVDKTLYRSVIGSLRYLVHTRPDIAYAVGVMSRYMEAPTTEHMTGVKQILRYVKGTMNLGCVYMKEQSKEELIGYSDSDLAGDVDDRKSTTGVMYFLGRSPITWVSQKQRVVALSSCEAEYIAGTAGACQGVWLGRVLNNLRGDNQIKALLMIDNKSAIALAKNPVFHDRSKHIDTRYHFIRECVMNGDIKVEHVSTEIQLADLLTKPLGRQRFVELREMIGMKIIVPG